ncbi:hypothetical protein [Burkholderia cepacia]|uniref:hypothetical protein n=1 Tax=Burkholderia cepacia TaxID=292 RepID=UPI000F5F7100|nr:hypothetical protein [Burkholderia cepacia]
MMSYSTGCWSSHLNDFNIDEEVFLLIVARCRLQSVDVDREMKLTLISISPARRSMEWLEFPCRSPRSLPGRSRLGGGKPIDVIRKHFNGSSELQRRPCWHRYQQRQPDQAPSITNLFLFREN